MTVFHMSGRNIIALIFHKKCIKIARVIHELQSSFDFTGERQVLLADEKIEGVGVVNQQVGINTQWEVLMGIDLFLYLQDRTWEIINVASQQHMKYSFVIGGAYNG